MMVDAKCVDSQFTTQPPTPFIILDKLELSIKISLVPLIT